jgi:hypothetical protein
MPKVCQLLRFKYVQLAILLVAATIALTPLRAKSPLRKTLAIHLQTVNLGALAALVRLLAWGEVHLRDCSENIIVFDGLSTFIYEEVEKILCVGHAVLVSLDLVLGNEFERAGGGRGASRFNF